MSADQTPVAWVLAEMGDEPDEPRPKPGSALARLLLDLADQCNRPSAPIVFEGASRQLEGACAAVAALTDLPVLTVRRLAASASRLPGDRTEVAVQLDALLRAHLWG